MTKHFGLIPAAGNGTRMGESTPKQYRSLVGRPMIFHAIERMCAEPQIDRVYVALAPEDGIWRQHDWTPFSAKLHVLHCGGETRARTVMNALEALVEEVRDHDWVVVHDAARPCLSQARLANLIATLGHDEVGGLLAIPLADTLKRADANCRVESTEPRESLWQAQTPQMFRFGLLRKAFQSSRAGVPTDEARAVENLGLRPLLVMGEAANLKVTYPEDAPLAELILRYRQAP